MEKTGPGAFASARKRLSFTQNSANATQSAEVVGLRDLRGMPDDSPEARVPGFVVTNPGTKSSGFQGLVLQA